MKPDFIAIASRMAIAICGGETKTFNDATLAAALADVLRIEREIWEEIQQQANAGRMAE